MTKELTMVKWILEGKLNGCINARDYAFEKMSGNEKDEELRRLYENMYREFAYKARVMRDVLEEIERSVEGWE